MNDFQKAALNYEQALDQHAAQYQSNMASVKRAEVRRQLVSMLIPKFEGDDGSGLIEYARRLEEFINE